MKNKGRSLKGILTLKGKILRKS